MKEQALIDEQITQVQNHGGDINSNLGENLPFKEKLEAIIENSSTINGEFDVALNGICTVIKRIDNYISSMSGVKIDSRRIRRAPIENQYYPNTQSIHVNEPVMDQVVHENEHIMENSVVHPPESVTSHERAHAHAHVVRGVHPPESVTSHERSHAPRPAAAHAHAPRPAAAHAHAPRPAAAHAHAPRPAAHSNVPKKKNKKHSRDEE
jgi:hypothetical protein